MPTLKPIHSDVIIHNMEFGEQKTASGIVLTSDDGKDRGIYPRWGQIYAKGPENTEEYDVGDWILVEHGRWTRGFNIDVTTVVRKVDTNAIIMWSPTKPNDILITDGIYVPPPVEEYRI